ncbi:hypothetical protein CsSME_00001547 [Camellia sinensis var. sinensis]|uniref:DUF4408 domain-containing protein n=1 Tax=Camellia sinensis var. sinensis TaxID=542762 RepID=A0A4S4ESB8_CAMSN|nr:hypothetical protein TEA_026532 [Camellia sinensis var. sinensis]
MLDSTIELISLAASNSIVVFCFCNFIIIGILLVGGAKPPSEFVQDSPIPPPTVDHRNQNGDIEGTITTCSLNNDDDALTVDSESCAEKAMVDEEEEKEKENEEDDELRRRVEEFIDKINRGWKAEKSRTSLLV